MTSLDQFGAKHSEHYNLGQVASRLGLSEEQVVADLNELQPAKRRGPASRAQQQCATPLHRRTVLLPIALADPDSPCTLLWDAKAFDRWILHAVSQGAIAELRIQLSSETPKGKGAA